MSCLVDAPPGTSYQGMFITLVDGVFQLGVFITLGWKQAITLNGIDPFSFISFLALQLLPP